MIKIYQFTIITNDSWTISLSELNNGLINSSYLEFQLVNRTNLNRFEI